MTAMGEFVTARFGKRFMFSLLNQRITLQPGKYIFMIDPIWNKTVNNDELFKDVLVDIYAPTSVNLTQIDDY